MGRKYEPDRNELKKAWRVKRRGGTERDVIQKLGIGPGQYERARAIFNAYYRRQKLLENNRSVKRRPGKAVKTPTKTSGPNYKRGEQKLRPEDIDLDVLRSYVICGFNRDKIAGLLGISRTKLYLLMKESKEISDVINRSIEETVADVLKNGLLVLCKEHELPDTHFASYQGDIFTKDHKKKFRPHLGAIKYLFSNTVGWQSENKPKTPNNKGAILRMMDEVANHDDDVGPEDADQQEDTPT